MEFKEMIKKILLSVCFIASVVGISSAQQTEIYHDAERHYKLGYELFSKEKYSAAIEEFEKTLKNPDGVSHSMLVDAAYYSAAGSAELFNKDAEYKLLNYLRDYPTENKTKLAAFYLGKWYFKQKQYKKASQYFVKSDVLMLGNDDVSEFYFKSGYSYFMAGDLTLAGKQFQQIINVDSKYQSAANFYYAHIAYSSKNYETALKSFNKLNESESFAPFAPYYITQIYFQQDKYAEVISYAPTALQKPNIQNASEIKRILAESYFRTNDYKNAAATFSDYKTVSGSLNRDDLYKSGFSYYKTNNYDKAIDNLQKVVNINDTLAQNAYYNLADCYLKKNNKENARTAFQQASKSDFNPAIKEDALFNYGKLSFEAGNQSAAINAFTDYSKKYSGTAKADKANEYLAELYLSTKNYKDALAVLETISTKSNDAKRAYQKVAFYRGSELYNDGDYVKAISLFEKAIVNKSNEKISAEAIYWKAEALYKQKKYDLAVKQYRTFIFYPAALNLNMYNQANYDLAYVNFKLENWQEATIWFRKYLKDRTGENDIRTKDAMARLGDSYFMLKDYSTAKTHYNDAIKNKIASADYCYFQIGIIAGLQSDVNGKILAMQNIEQDFPRSNYLDDAYYEEGRALLEKGNESEAQLKFKKLINDFPKSNYLPQAQLKSALIDFNAGNNGAAEASYKEVIKANPQSMDAVEALNGLKNIYVKDGTPDKLKEVYDNLPLPKLTEGAQDSIFYESAEQSLQREDYKKAVEAFDSYLNKFPNGSFSLNAIFYKAESNLKLKNYEVALTGFEDVIARPKNVFTEKSLFRAGSLNYFNKNYQKALDEFQRLEQIADFKDNLIASIAGQMRCNFFLNNCDGVIQYSQKLLAVDNATSDLIQEAHFYYGKCALQKEDLVTARVELKEVEKIQSSRGAEAKYSLALILYKEKKYKESQKKVYEVINQVPSYDFWIAKSYILLAENSLALKDTFQAKSTLKSIIDNYEKKPGDSEDVVATAQEKYNSIIMDENKVFRKEEDFKNENDSVK